MGRPGKNSGGSSRTYKGKYEIHNPEKYMGNPLECMYDSSWEKRFMVYL